MPERTRGLAHQRDPTDYYATAPELARLVCQTIRGDFGLSAPERILEPGCGAGTFLSAIRDTWPQAELFGVEIQKELAEFAKRAGFDVAIGDVLSHALDEVDLIVGNPPFRYADEFIPVLLRHLRPGGVLAFILRLNFLAGGKRYGTLWTKYPPARIYPLPSRPGFTADGGTDATDYMVCVWVANHTGPTIMTHLDNRNVANRWTDATAYPDPRTPSDARISPGVTLNRWSAPERRKVMP